MLENVNPKLWTKAQSSGLIVTSAIIAGAALVALVIISALADQQRVLSNQKYDEAIEFKNQFHPKASWRNFGFGFPIQWTTREWLFIPDDSDFWDIWDAAVNASHNSCYYGVAAFALSAATVGSFYLFGHGLYKLNRKLGEERADDQESRGNVQHDDHISNGIL